MKWFSKKSEKSKDAEESKENSIQIDARQQSDSVIPIPSPEGGDPAEEQVPLTAATQKTNQDNKTNNTNQPQTQATAPQLLCSHSHMLERWEFLPEK